eukprot:7344946-Alexandrium_andersonii.AAC.3
MWSSCMWSSAALGWSSYEAHVEPDVELKRGARAELKHGARIQSSRGAQMGSSMDPKRRARGSSIVEITWNSCGARTWRTHAALARSSNCLLYTSDAADDM